MVWSLLVHLVLTGWQSHTFAAEPGPIGIPPEAVFARFKERDQTAARAFTPNISM